MDTEPLDMVVTACQPLGFAPLPLVAAEPPEGGTEDTVRGPERWRRADEFVRAGGVGESFQRHVDREAISDRPALAMRYMRSLFREIVFLVSTSVYLGDCAPELGADQLWLRIDENGCLGTPMLAPARAAVLTGHRAQDGGVVVLSGREELDRWAATQLVACCSPFIDELHRHTKLGTRVLWGYIVDCLHFYMLNPARWLGNDMAEAFRRAEQLAEALAEAGAPRRKRPRLVTFGDDDHAAWGVRGTCCFDYRADPAHGFCVTCPLERDEARKPRLAEAFPSSEFGSVWRSA